MTLIFAVDDGGRMMSGRASDEVVERSRIQFHRDVNDYDGYDVDVGAGSIVVVPLFPKVVVASVGLPSVPERTPGLPMVFIVTAPSLLLPRISSNA